MDWQCTKDGPKQDTQKDYGCQDICEEKERAQEGQAREMDQGVEDLNIMDVKGWGTLVKRRSAWKHIMEEVKAHPGLQYQLFD